MSRQEMIQHYARLVRRWPTDLLRPERQTFQHLLKSRIRQAPEAGKHDDIAEINAAYSLLDNNLQRRFALSKEIMEPESNPAYYSKLANELKEIPGRTFLGSLVKRLQNLVRWK